MNLWQLLDARAARRAARHEFLVERGLDNRSLARATFEKLDPRFFIAGAIILLFAFAFARETDQQTRNILVGAIVAAFAGAWGYYLGSSNSASQANDRAERVTEIAHAAMRQQRPPAPRNPAEAAEQTADAAVGRAEEIEEASGR